MRTVAAWSLTQTTPSTDDAKERFSRYRGTTLSWLQDKGLTNPQERTESFSLPNSRTASFERDDLHAEQGNIEAFTLSEPWGATGSWYTRFTLAQRGSAIALFCQMQVGAQAATVSDENVDPNCPIFLRTIMDDGPWNTGVTRIPKQVSKYLGASAADGLADLLWDKGRHLPVVVVSEYDDFTLHPRIEEAISRDLRGLAHVALIDTEAAWRLTEIKGKDWACFWGAVRLYWPMNSLVENPFRHPYWTPDRLRRGNVTTAHAAQRARSTLRRQVFSRSTALREPDLIADIRRSRRQRLIDQAKESAENFDLADSYSAEVTRIEKELSDLREEADELAEDNRELRARLKSANEQIAYYEGRKPERSDMEDNPDPESQPQLTSVSAAVDAAMKECEHLIFGGDVVSEASRLATDAGPPTKVLEQLRHLDEMARLLGEKKGSLGTTQMQWLRRRNIEVSGENETIQNSPSAMQRRTWDDGSGNRLPFEAHLKTSEATSPDRCVRIYYKWVTEERSLVVGSVGRHPE